MKKTKGILSVLLLLLLLFYLSVFAILEYNNSKSISDTPSDRWPLAGQVLAGLSNFIAQVNNRPTLLFAWVPKDAGLKAGELIQSAANENEQTLVLPDYVVSSGEKTSGFGYLKTAFKDGAFNLKIVWARLTNYLNQLK